MGTLPGGGGALGSIVLIGFMGSGKTTLGRAVAARLALPFVDLDAEVEKQLGTTIRAYMQQHGEAAFREQELSALAALAVPRRRLVLATGGGIVETAAARRQLAALGTVVWLVASPATCVRRLGAARARRPLLDDDNWQVRFTHRLPLYAALANLQLDTEHNDVASCVETLVLQLRAARDRAAGSEP